LQSSFEVKKADVTAMTMLLRPNGQFVRTNSPAFAAQATAEVVEKLREPLALSSQAVAA